VSMTSSGGDRSSWVGKRHCCDRRHEPTQRGPTSAGRNSMAYGEEPYFWHEKVRAVRRYC
jgi:hypothetical protein